MIEHKYRLPFPDVPGMPEEIIHAIDDGNLLLFVGAGVSKLIGYPLWGELGRNLANKALKERILTNSEKEVLLEGGFTPMEIVSIVTKRFDENKANSGTEEIIKELSTNVKEDAKVALKICKYLSAYNSVIVTTNADISLEKRKTLKSRVLCKNFEKDFDLKKYGKYSIIHLHGSIEEPDGMVFTSEDYARAYSVETDFGKKLKDLFNGDWTILFLGYGVTEFELLRYFLTFKKDKVRRLFLLEGYLAKDRIKYEFDKEYYESLGISLLPYSRELSDYKMLLKVLQKWDKDVKTRTFSASTVKEDAIANITSQEPYQDGIEAIERMLKKNG